MKTPEVHFIQTGIGIQELPNFKHPQRWAIMINFIARHMGRWERVVGRIEEDLQAGRRVVCVSDRLGLAKKFLNYFQSRYPTYNTCYLTGGEFFPDDKDVIHKRLESGSCKLLITSPLIDGLLGWRPLHNFNTLHFATPTSSRFMGRINVVKWSGNLKEAIPTTPLVRYYVDKNPIFKHIHHKLRKQALAEGYRIVDEEVDR